MYLAHTGLMALSPRAFASGVAAILLAAGAFGLSSFRWACLRACRSPLVLICQGASQLDGIGTLL